MMSGGGALYQQNKHQYKYRTISSEILTHSTHSLCTHMHAHFPFHSGASSPLHHALFCILFLLVVNGALHVLCSENCGESC